jgi:hypothetical protein
MIRELVEKARGIDLRDGQLLEVYCTRGQVCHCIGHMQDGTHNWVVQCVTTIDAFKRKWQVEIERHANMDEFYIGVVHDDGAYVVPCDVQYTRKP